MIINFRDIITYDHIYDYLTADNNTDLSVWKDGTVIAIEHGITYPVENPVARVRCPGINNIDTSWYTNDFCETRTENGEYVVDGRYREDKGRVVGSIEDVISECCKDGDMTEEYDGLIDALERSYEIYRRNEQ